VARAGGIGNARERPVLRRHVSGGALLDIPVEQIFAKTWLTTAPRASRDRRGYASGTAARRGEAGQRATDLPAR